MLISLLNSAVKFFGNRITHEIEFYIKRTEYIQKGPLRFHEMALWHALLRLVEWITFWFNNGIALFSVFADIGKL
jgi:hypothetical protein